MLAMKLYWFWSFNPQKVRLALNELGVAHEIVKVDLFRREQQQPEFLKLNPAGKVPVLEDDGMVLAESNAILVYLGEKTGRLWPADPRQRGAALRWLFFEARHVSDPLGACWFYDYVAPKVRIPVDEAARSRANEQLPGILGLVETQLGANRWLLGEDFSLVDCCYGAAFDALSRSRFSLADFPAIRGYLDRVRERPAWEKCEFRRA